MNEWMSEWVNERQRIRTKLYNLTYIFLKKIYEIFRINYKSIIFTLSKVTPNMNERVLFLRIKKKTKNKERKNEERKNKQ